MDCNHQKIISGYATKCFHRLRREGLWYEREDLEGEFSICYAKAVQMFREDSPASFETYLIAAINNRFLDIRKKLINETKGWVAYQGAQHRGEAPDDHSTIDVKSTLEAVSETLTLSERTILDELLSPSEAVLAQMPDTHGRRSYFPNLMRAISTAHAFHYNEVRYRVDKIRNRVKKALPAV